MRKKRQKPEHKFTKRQLSRWQQKKNRRLIILGLGIFIVAALLGVVGVSWYFNQYRPLHQTVIRVNNTEFNMDYYIKMLKYYGEGYSIKSMYVLADKVVTVIERNELIRQEAMKLGITVSQDEVDKELKSRGLPLSKVYRDVVSAKMLINKLEDEYFEKEVPVFAEQRHMMAMFLESESQVAQVRARIEAGEEFADLAGELSLESFSREANGDLGWHPKGVLTIILGTSVVDEYAFRSEVGILGEPAHDEEIIKDVGYWIAKVTKWQAKVLGILLDSEEEAQNVRDRLEAGEDFGELAEKLSQDEASRKGGGRLGSWAPGEAGPAFDEFVFNTEIELGLVSQPIFDDSIATQGGYWLIKVLERKAKVLGILLGSEEEAENVRDRLEAGEDFGELAVELSQHKSSKQRDGNLGWLRPGKMSPAFDEFVFSTEIELGLVSQPIFDDISTKGGYWLIKVVDKDDNRQVEDSDRDLLKAEAMKEWIERVLNDPENKIENYLDKEKKVWAIEQAMKR